MTVLICMEIIMEMIKRRPNRLKGYDYSQNGAYFVTVCTKNREEILWDVGATIGRPLDNIILSDYGIIVNKAILNIPKYYPSIIVDKYVIMPNHIHLILIIQNQSGRAMHAPTISTVIQQMKGYVTKQIGFCVWQKLFHDHIIRGESDYMKIWQYIDTNPLKWEDDCFYNK